MKPVVLSANNICVHRAGRALLNHVSINLRAGEVTVVMGENGAGKSTLLNVCAGDVAPDSGSVTMADRMLYEWKAIERAKMRAVLPQESTLTFMFTALEVVLLGRSPHCHGYPGAHDHAIARLALERLEVSHLAERLYPTLSGGERARVMLARVFAQVWERWSNMPRCLLLDEPIAALDIAHQHIALAAAKSFATEQGIAVLAVLHDLNLATQYADEVTLLKNGALFATGAPAETLTIENVEACFGLGMVSVKHPVHARRVLVAA